MKFTNASMKYFIENEMNQYLYKHKKEILAATRVDINWDFLSMLVSTEFILGLFQDKLNWKIVSGAAELSDDIMTTFYDKLDKDLISQHQTLSKPFIIAHAADLNWTKLHKYQELATPSDMTVIAAHPSYIDNDLLLAHNQVSETWLEDNYGSLDKNLISRYQLVSQQFILDHAADLDFKSLIVGGSISTQSEFIMFQPSTEINLAIEFITMDMAFIEMNYSTLNKLRIWRYHREYTDQFLSDHLADINWTILSKFAILTESQMETYWESLDKILISKYQVLSEAFMDTHLDNLDTKLLSRYQTIGENLILKYPSRFDLNYLALYQVLSDTSLRSPISYMMPFNVVSASQELTEAQATYFKDRLVLNKVIKRNTLPFTFVFDNIDKFSKYDVCRYCAMNEANILTLNAISMVEWNSISKYQVLSEAFMDTYKTFLNIDLLLNNQTMSSNFRSGLIQWYLDQ